MAISEMDGKVITPCIGICKLKDNICIGCKRTIEEIKEQGLIEGASKSAGGRGVVDQ